MILGESPLRSPSPDRPGPGTGTGSGRRRCLVAVRTNRLAPDPRSCRSTYYAETAYRAPRIGGKHCLLLKATALTGDG